MLYGHFIIIYFFKELKIFIRDYICVLKTVREALIVGLKSTKSGYNNFK